MAASIKDKPLVIKTALDDGDRWATSNHTGTYTNDLVTDKALNETKPTIRVIYDLKIALQGATNHIFIFQVSDLNDLIPYATGNRKDENGRMRVIIRAATRPDMLTRLREAERILETLRTTIGNITMPSGYVNCFNQVWILNRIDRSDEDRKFHYGELDVDVRSIGVVLANA